MRIKFLQLSMKKRQHKQNQKRVIWVTVHFVTCHEWREGCDW